MAVNCSYYKRILYIGEHMTTRLDCSITFRGLGVSAGVECSFLHHRLYKWTPVAHLEEPRGAGEASED